MSFPASSAWAGAGFGSLAATVMNAFPLQGSGRATLPILSGLFKAQPPAGHPTRREMRDWSAARQRTAWPRHIRDTDAAALTMSYSQETVAERWLAVRSR